MSNKVTCKTCTRKFKMSKKDDCVCDNACCPIIYDISGMELEFTGPMMPDNLDIISVFNTAAPKISDSEMAYSKWLEEGGDPRSCPF